MLILMCYDYDQYNIILIITFVITFHQLVEYNLAHRRSVAELCMLFKIKSNPMHPLSGALPLPYVPGVILVVLWCS